VTSVADPVLRALVDGARTATGGADAWLVARRDGHLEIVAAAGPVGTTLQGARVASDEGTAGFVVSYGQPMAIALRGDDPRATSGLAVLLGRAPATVLSVPCEADDGIVGALEVVDKADGARFTFEDVELVTLLAGVASAALQAVAPPRVPQPDELAHALHRLADADPSRYQTVAALLRALVADG
jgi:GAF domain-containing protein